MECSTYVGPGLIVVVARALGGNSNLHAWKGPILGALKTQPKGRNVSRYSKGTTWAELGCVDVYRLFPVYCQHTIYLQLYSRTDNPPLYGHLGLQTSLRLGSFLPGAGIFLFSPKYLCSPASPGVSLPRDLVLRLLCSCYIQVRSWQGLRHHRHIHVFNAVMPIKRHFLVLRSSCPITN